MVRISGGWFLDGKGLGYRIAWAYRTYTGQRSKRFPAGGLYGILFGVRRAIAALGFCFGIFPRRRNEYGDSKTQIKSQSGDGSPHSKNRFRPIRPRDTVKRQHTIPYSGEQGGAHMIFINYRKADTQPVVDNLTRELKRHFGDKKGLQGRRRHPGR